MKAKIKNENIKTALNFLKKNKIDESFKTINNLYSSLSDLEKGMIEERYRNLYLSLEGIKNKFIKDKNFLLKEGIKFKRNYANIYFRLDEILEEIKHSGYSNEIVSEEVKNFVLKNNG